MVHPERLQATGLCLLREARRPVGPHLLGRGTVGGRGLGERLQLRLPLRLPAGQIVERVRPGLHRLLQRLGRDGAAQAGRELRDVAVPRRAA